MKLYLDSSAIIKRYVLEEGTEKVNDTYLEALSGNASLHFSILEYRRGSGSTSYLLQEEMTKENEDYTTARESFIAETTRLIKLGVAKVIPVKSKLLTQSMLFVKSSLSWELINSSALERLWLLLCSHSDL